MMLASVLVKRGGATVIEQREHPDPGVEPGQVLIELRAAALNHLDLYGYDAHAAREDAPAKIIGSDGAGVVRSVGSGVGRVEIGQEVVLDPGLSCGACGACGRGEESECASFDIVGRGVPGTLAELVAVPAANVAPKPPHLTFDQAAALPLAHLTATRMLFSRGHLQAGETVLIHGIGGGVALAALQLAKLAAAEVIVTSSSPAKLERALELGADQAVDYARHADVATEVRRLTGGRGVDLVVDTVGAATLAASVSSARNGGRVVSCGATTGAEGSVDIREIFWRQISLIGSTMGSRDDFRRMLRAASAHRLVPVIDSVLPAAALSAGLEKMRRAEQFGKIVVTGLGGQTGGSDSSPRSAALQESPE